MHTLLFSGTFCKYTLFTISAHAIETPLTESFHFPVIAMERAKGPTHSFHLSRDGRLRAEWEVERRRDSRRGGGRNTAEIERSCWMRACTASLEFRAVRRQEWKERGVIFCKRSEGKRRKDAECWHISHSSHTPTDTAPHFKQAPSHVTFLPPL